MSQTVRARYDYDPYGNVTKVSGDRDSDFLYTGHFWHAQSGLYLTLYRAYDAKLGRWISRDPIAESGGLNLYAYVANKPILLTDPLGLAWDWTPTQGYHWNDRTSNLAFKPAWNAEKGWHAVPMWVGKHKHEFDPVYSARIMEREFRSVDKVFSQYNRLSDVRKYSKVADPTELDELIPAMKNTLKTLGKVMAVLMVIDTAQMALNAEDIGKALKQDACDIANGDVEGGLLAAHEHFQQLAPGAAGAIAWRIFMSRVYSDQTGD